MATTLLLAPVTAGTGDTGLTLSSSRIPCNSVTIQAHPDNTVRVWVGDSSVGATAERGIILEAPTATTSPSITFTSGNATNGLNLADFFVVSGSASQKVNVLYLTS